jgi:methylated-DNA-[protein]-cysteine S-methyltransferase
MTVKKPEMKQRDLAGENTALCYSIINSPIDDLLLVADATALIGLYFVGCAHLPSASKHWRLDARHSVLLQAGKQLQEYFAGKRKAFSIPLRPWGTHFQETIWREIASIPYGATISYSELSKRAGTPQAIRAAGTATGRNPLSIIIPCHRVVGKDGRMCGFAGGLERKQHLLALETSNVDSPSCRDKNQRHEKDQLERTRRGNLVVAQRQVRRSGQGNL